MDIKVAAANDQIRTQIQKHLSSLNSKEVATSFYEPAELEAGVSWSQNKDIWIIDESVAESSPYFYDTLMESDSTVTLLIIDRQKDQSISQKASENIVETSSSDFGLSLLNLFLKFGRSHQESLRYEKLLKENGVVFAQMAHELKNSLTIIQSKCEKMVRSLNKYSLSKEFIQVFTQHCEKVDKTVFKMNEVVNEIIRKSQKVKDNPSLPEQPKSTVLFIDIVWAAVDSCSDLLQTHDIQVKENINPDLQLQCDVNAFTVVMVNLVKNSIDAVKGLNERWIKINTSKNDKDLIIEVVDSGLGVKNQSKIFKDHFTTKSKEGGHGLGLGIVKKYLESLNGNIEYSLKNNYTCFKITIPKAFKE